MVQSSAGDETTIEEDGLRALANGSSFKAQAASGDMLYL
jgi:hypothetical protein